MTEEECPKATKGNADYVKSWAGEDAASRLSEIVAREEEDGRIGFVHGSHAGCEKCGAKSMSMAAARMDNCLLSALLVCSSCDEESVLMVVGLADDTVVVKMFPAENEIDDDEDEDDGGLQPIEGQPGVFRDMASGRIINIGDHAGGPAESLAEAQRWLSTNAEESSPAAAVITTTTTTTETTVTTTTTETTADPEVEGAGPSPAAPHAEACGLELRLLVPTDLCGKCGCPAGTHRNYPEESE